MGLFGKIFEKKICSICDGEIGMLGNRKLEDGNCCKNCAAKLSPFFSDRRRSTVEDIKAQLEYREENKKAVAAFNTTRTLGRDMKILFDEDAKKFMVTKARNLAEANPDVLDYTMVTGCDIDIDEDTSEEKYTNNEGNYVSHNPPIYFYDYDFNVIIHVNHPYFDTIKFQLNPSSIRINPDNAVPASRKPRPDTNVDYREYTTMAREIKELLTSARTQVREEVAAANKPKTAIQCPCCGATTIPDANGCCEFCGGATGA